MNFGTTVARQSRRLRRTPLRRASVRVVTRDVPDAFADAVVRARVAAVTLVTPWVSDDLAGCDAFDRILGWSTACEARVHLITRPPLHNEPHRRTLSAVLAAGGRVTVNPQLHAKILIAEFANGSRTAVVGSANLTAGAYSLLETALLVASSPTRRGPDVVDDLLTGPVLRFTNHRDSRDIRTI
jgi:hypothetical protein